MAVNFPSNPSDGDTVLTGTKLYTYHASKGVWKDSDGDDVTQSTLDNYLEVANSSSIGVTTYSALSDLPLSGQSTGKMAYVSGTNRLYLWAGSGWYNIALVNTDPSISGASSTYNLDTGGANTVVTLASSDPEGLPISFSLSTSGLGIGANAIATVTQSNNIFTFTPTTNTALAGTFTATFTASDGVNVAVANSSFTLAFSVNNSNYTTALITSVGTNNQVNNDFVDSSTNSHTITTGGNATQTTFSPYRHGGYSTYFDGSSDYLTIADDASLDFGTGDFTVECWINLPTNSSNNPIIFGSGWYFQTKTSDSILSFYTGSTEYTYSIGSSLDTSTWHHIAAARSGSTLKVFLNGTEVKSVGNSDNIQTTGSGILIGRLSGSTSFDFKGYVTDVRVVKGTAVYTSAFTPPTERLTAITNTSLLTCHLPYIADGSTNDHSITVTGNTKTEPFAPYDYEQYSATGNGGSMYFDGNGDYVKVTNTTTSVSGDFTIECWVNFTSYASSGANSRVFSMKPGGNTADNLQLIVGISSPGTAGSVSVWTNAYICHASTVVSDGSWHHIAVTRESGTVKVYIDGALDGSGSSSTTFDFSGHKIGTRDETADATSKFTGSISDFRTVVGTAVYTSNFTPPTAPLADITNTLALVRGTNAGIIDKSQSLEQFTLKGDTKSSTVQSKYLTSSMYFDGTGDYIQWYNDGLFDLGLNGAPFTMEWWQYWPTIATGINLGPQVGGGTAGWNSSTGHQWTFFTYSSSTTLFAQWWNGSSRTDYEFSHGSALTAGTWQHFANVYDGTNLATYVAGSRIANRTSGNTFGKVSSGTIATLGANASAQGNFNGYISDCRITKGLARYSGATITPPTSALLG